MSSTSRAVRGPALVLIAVVLVAACSSSGSSKTTGGTGANTATTAGAVSNSWALTYTGGSAGKADATKSPVVIGYVNEEGGVPAFPEATQGIDAAVSYVNDELGGIQGHPISLEKCFVQTEEDGQKCGTQLANDARVKLVIVGAMALGNQSLYSVLAGKKPILNGNPIANPDYLTSGVIGYTPGAPGVIRGLAIFLSKYLPTARKISVIHGDDPAAVFAAQNLFKPLANKLGLTDVTLVQVSDTASAPDVQQALQSAGADKADVIVPIVEVQLCIASYDALQSLGIKSTVVTTGLCFGTPMTKHLHDLGSKDVVPNGWYFGGYGYSYFIPDDASGMSTYLAKVHQYGPKDVEYTGFAGPTFANLMTAVKIYNQLGPDPAADALLTALKSFKGPMMIAAGPMSCGFDPLFKTLCGTQMGVEQYKDGKWTPIADALNNQAIDASKP